MARGEHIQNVANHLNIKNTLLKKWIYQGKYKRVITNEIKNPENDNDNENEQDNENNSEI